MINVYIVHYKKLVERKAYLINELSKYNFNVVFVDEFERETLNETIIDGRYDASVELWNDRVKNLYSFTLDFRELEKSEICNSLSHLKAFELISKNTDEYSIVLEDDSRLVDNFEQRVLELMNNTPKDFSFIFMGDSYSIEQLDSCNLSSTTQISDGVYLKEPGKTRTVDGYILSTEAAKLYHNEIKKIILPFDFELNYFFKTLNTKVYWWQPIISQGSRTGAYLSSIR